jgi:hypothetical protein
MWLRMMSKSPICSRQMMSTVSGKTWDEWFNLLDAQDQRKKGITLVMRYLIDKYAVTSGCARSIAIQYVLQYGASHLAQTTVA